MGATPYQPLSWADNEPMYTDKLNGMTNNEQWLYENAPRVFYNASGVQRTAGVKILTGFNAMPPGGEHTGHDFYFGSFFSAGCLPVVTATVACCFPKGRLTVSVRGIGTAWVDSRGFECRVWSVENTGIQTIPAGVWVSFIAIGW